jgi:UDP-N-acetylglucosamine 4,6-dehydratase
MSDFTWTDKVVLITGATGTVGQLVLQALFNTNVKRIIIFSRDEYKQWQLRKLYGNNCKLLFIIGDMKNAASIKRACEGVDVLIHTAAMKHIDICEDNVYETVDTNIGGARNVVEACIENGVQRCLFISTDKANNPNNVYGASKLLSDKICLAANRTKRAGNWTCDFSVVRFGNIFGSRGSVVEFFRAIAEKATLSVNYDTGETYKHVVFPITHMNMTRIFIEKNDVAKSILLCVENMKGGEIFVPEMKTMYIRDIAKAFYLQLCINQFDRGGVNKFTNVDTMLDVIGLRSGEKLSECMISAEDMEKTWKTKWGMFAILEDGNIDGEKMPSEYKYDSENAVFYTIDEIIQLLTEFSV